VAPPLGGARFARSADQISGDRPGVPAVAFLVAGGSGYRHP